MSGALAEHSSARLTPTKTENPMRQNTSLAAQPTVGRRQAGRVSYATSNSTHQAWYKRATEHAILVRRAIAGAKDETISAIGLGAVVRMMRGGSAGELLVTRRFA